MTGRSEPFSSAAISGGVGRGAGGAVSIAVMNGQPTYWSVDEKEPLVTAVVIGARRRSPATVRPVPTASRWLLAVFTAWTLFVWGNRISNAWSSASESTSAKVVSTLLAGSFLLFALGGIVVLVRSWRSPVGDGAVRFLMVFAGWTTLVWSVRIVLIVLADHSVGFKVVHAALGLISVALAVCVARGATVGHEPRFPQSADFAR